MPDLALLRSLLPDTPIQAPAETVSTNTDARRWLQEGAAHGSLVAADRQTAGRGRLGRSFASADGGLYMSVVIKSDLPAGLSVLQRRPHGGMDILRLRGLRLSGDGELVAEGAPVRTARVGDKERNIAVAHIPISSSAFRAASCSACFFVRPMPFPMTLEFRWTSTSKRLSWSGPDSPTRT